MIRLWGSDYTRLDLLRRLGDISQIAGAQPFELSDGRERGSRGVRLYNAAGLELQVIAERGLGITALSFQGIPLPYISPVGTAHPAYAEATGLGWLRNWPGGFLTPCGLTQVGSPCDDVGAALGLHGRVSNLPARNVHWGGEWVGEDYQVWVEGIVQEAAVFGENLTLVRRIWTGLAEPRFWIEDRVVNHGFSPAPLMFLQHINLGFPLVDSTARLELPQRVTEPRDEPARQGLGQHCEFHEPVNGYQEQVFYHYLEVGEDGDVRVGLNNPAFYGGRGLSLYIQYPLQEYPVLVEWKMMGVGMYVVGIEPANCHVGGRCQERERGTLQMLAPQETRTFHLEIGFATGKS